MTSTEHDRILSEGVERYELATKREYMETLDYAEQMRKQK